LKKDSSGKPAADANRFDPNGFNAGLSRQGHLTKARRFNAGLGANKERVSEGRPKSCPNPQPSLRDSTCRYAFPALKRRATIEKSLRDSADQNLSCARRPHRHKFLIAP